MRRADATVSIEWHKSMAIAVDVDLSRDNGESWKRLASDQVGGKFDWHVTPPVTNSSLIRVVDSDLYTSSDVSNATFRIRSSAGIAGVPDEKPGPSFSPPHPNPSRGAVGFTLRMARAGAATVEVFDLAGRRVRTLARGIQTPGEHAIAWDGRLDGGAHAADGIYFVRARLPGFQAVRRV